MKNILLIDDDQGLIKVIAKSLSKNGYEVISCLNGKDGFQEFKKNHFPLVITDLEMPGELDGHKLINELSKEAISPIIIVITGHKEINTIIDTF